MIGWPRLLTPPEWGAWSAIQRVVYWAIFIGGMVIVTFLAKSLVNWLFGLVGL